MINKISDRCENVVQFDQFRAQKNKSTHESVVINDLKLLQAGYFAQNDLLAIITNLIHFQEVTKRVVGDEIYQVIEDEMEKEE